MVPTASSRGLFMANSAIVTCLSQSAQSAVTQWRSMYSSSMFDLSVCPLVCV